MFSFPEATEQLKQAATAAAAAVVQGGKLKPVRHEGVMSLGTAEVKRLLPGSLVLWKDDTLSYVPMTRGVIEARDTGALSFSTRTSPSGAASQKDEAFMNANVKMIALGKLTIGGVGGAEADGLICMGVPAELSIGGTADPFELTVSTGGAAQKKTLAEVNRLLELKWRPWAGGTIDPPVLVDASIKGRPEAATVDVPIKMVAGDGATSALRKATLETLGLCSGDNVKAADLAGGLGAWAHDPDVARTLQVALAAAAEATRPATAGSVAEAVIGKVDALMVAVRHIADGLPRAAVAQAAESVEKLGAEGLLSPVAAGNAMRAAAMTAGQPAGSGSAAGGTDSPGGGGLAGGAGLDGGGTPAGGSGGAGLSPMSQMKQQLSTLQQNMAALAAGQTTSARALNFTSPGPPSGVDSSGGGTGGIGGRSTTQLSGLDILRVGTADDVAVLRQVDGGDGAKTVKRLAALLGDDDPPTSLSGVHAESTVELAGLNLDTVLAEARRGDAQGEFDFTTAPATWAEAAARLNRVIRAVKLGRSGASGGAGGQTSAQQPQTSDKAALKAAGATVSQLSRTPSEKDQRRAVGAEQLEPLTDAAVIVQSTTYAKQSDAHAEAARLVKLYGRPAHSFIFSNGTTEGKMAGDIVRLVVSGRTAVVRAENNTLSALMTDVMASTKATTLDSVVEGLVSADVPYDDCVVLFGSHAPTSQWRSASKSGKAAGRWGSLSEQSHIEEAMAVVDTTLVRLTEAGGGKAPQQGVFGLKALAKDAEGLGTDAVGEMFRDLFAVASRKAKRARVDASAPLLDWSAAVAEARVQALAPLERWQESFEGGKAGARSVLGKRGLAAGEDDDDASPKAPKGKHRGGKKQKEKDRRKEAAAAAVAAATKEPGGRGGGVNGGGVNVDISGGASGGGTPTLGEASVRCMMDPNNKAVSAVHVLEALHAAKMPGVAPEGLPCSWKAILGKCRDEANGKCERCKSGAAPIAECVAQVKAASVDKVKKNFKTAA